jgi:hypothetical protein
MLAETTRQMRSANPKSTQVPSYARIATVGDRDGEFVFPAPRTPARPPREATRGKKPPRYENQLKQAPQEQKKAPVPQPPQLSPL